jgi:hypothetical protein
VATYVYNADASPHRLTPEPSSQEYKGAVDLDDLSDGGLVIVLNTKEDADRLRTLVNDARTTLEEAHNAGLDQDDLIVETSPEGALPFTLRQLVDFSRDFLEMEPYELWFPERCLQAETTRDCRLNHDWDEDGRAYHRSPTR